jgi:hypothetical protein
MIQLSPDHGTIGTTMTISGKAFGTPGTVLFGTVVAQVSSWDGEQVVVTVPSNNAVTVRSSSMFSSPVWYRHSARVSVTVTPEGAAASDAMTFTYSNDDEGDDEGHGDGHHDGHDGH